MSGSNLMHGWMVLMGSLATIALILTAFGLMLGILKPANARRCIVAIACIVILFMLIPGVLVSAWLSLSLWQRVALAAIGIAVRQWPRPQSRKDAK